MEGDGEPGVVGVLLCDLELARRLKRDICIWTSHCFGEHGSWDDVQPVKAMVYEVLRRLASV